MPWEQKAVLGTQTVPGSKHLLGRTLYLRAVPVGRDTGWQLVDVRAAALLQAAIDMSGAGLSIERAEQRGSVRGWEGGCAVARAPARACCTARVRTSAA